MTKKKKAEEVIPDVIRRLSNNESISTSDVSKNNNISESSFKERLKDVRTLFYEHSFEPDKSTGKWVRTEASFLEKMLLTPEETVVLTGILRNKESFGDELTPWVEKIVDNYVKRTKTSVFKQDILEKIDDSLEIIFAQLKYAIEENRKIKFKFRDGHVIVYPYKIINLEYYWYILGYEEYSEYWKKEKKEVTRSKKVKTFTIAKIRGLEILDDVYKYNFDETEKELKNAMNAFFSVDDGSETIDLLVIHWLKDYISRAPYFSGWKKTDEIEIIDEDDYLVYEIKSSNKDCKDVIPTILKYMPNIRVRNNEILVEKIFEEIKIFAYAHNKIIKGIE